jgi:hypothetical protein
MTWQDILKEELDKEKLIEHYRKRGYDVTNKKDLEKVLDLAKLEFEIFGTNEERVKMLQLLLDTMG